ncbi:MAG: WecB/TagA/CpsF family glycosyltransferase [Xanthomonadales bacterium]|nr:WecB/TagA/CpsF family glycosyltransferase [Xanthomonadales bacterium]
MRTTQLFGNEICAGDHRSLARSLLQAMARGPKSVFFCNAHMLMLSREDEALAAAMVAADMVFADGVPVAWLQRRSGAPDADVLRGYEAVELICGETAGSDRKIGFLGSTEHVLAGLSKSLRERYPSLSIDYLHSPGMINDVIQPEGELIAQINGKNLHCLFVGLGCPKQEKWVQEYAPHLNCSLLAVGAAFDWLAGTTRKPPEWMEKSGLAWLFRLIENPAKMWHRYLIYNTKFMLASFKLLTWDKWTANG